MAYDPAQDRPLPPVKVELTTVQESWLERNSSASKTIGQQVDNLLSDARGTPTKLTIRFPKEDE